MLGFICILETDVVSTFNHVAEGGRAFCPWDTKIWSVLRAKDPDWGLKEVMVCGM